LRSISTSWPGLALRVIPAIQVCVGATKKDVDALLKALHGRLALLALTLVGELRVTAEPGRARLTPQRTVLAAEAAAACLIGTDGAEKVNLAKGRPQHVRKVELTVHALP